MEWGLEVKGSGGARRLDVVEFELLPLGPGDVRVRTEAAALNYRDHALIHGLSAGTAEDDYVPLSDACGIVEAVGTDVTEWSVGDRICSLFFPDWISGPALPATHQALGSGGRGVGKQSFDIPAHSVITAPQGLSAAEASTLPCAALTAWNAIMSGGGILPGQFVLLQGTGGVSLFALQFAKAAGAQVIITSSSDAKLEDMARLGADVGINYLARPDWAEAAREVTAGVGVDRIVEVGGAGTFSQSLRAIRLGGTISVVGMLTGAIEPIDMRLIYTSNAVIRGITVGSRSDFVAMNRAIASHKIRPVIARTFNWRQANDAFAALVAHEAPGKIVLDFTT